MKDDLEKLKLAEVYKPKDGCYVVEEPLSLYHERIMMSKFKKEVLPEDLDLVFTIIAVPNKSDYEYKLGDAVLVEGGAKLVPLMSERHYQISDFQIRGKILKENYKEIIEYYKEKRRNEAIDLPDLNKLKASGWDGNSLPDPSTMRSNIN